MRVELSASGDGGVPGIAARELRLVLDAGGGVFLAAGCNGAELTEVRVPAGVTSVELAYRPPLASSVSVTVSDPALDLAAATVSWPVTP